MNVFAIDILWNRRVGHCVGFRCQFAGDLENGGAERPIERNVVNLVDNTHIAIRLRQTETECHDGVDEGGAETILGKVLHFLFRILGAKRGEGSGAIGGCFLLQGGEGDGIGDDIERFEAGRVVDVLNGNELLR